MTTTSIIDRLVPYVPVPMVDDGTANQCVLGVTDDGLEINVPPLPFEWWMDADGNVLPIVISTNRAPPKHLDRSPRQEASKAFEPRYRDYIRDEQRARKGFFIEEHLEPQMPKRNEDGELVFVPPREKHPGARKLVDAELAKRQAKAKAKGEVYERMARSNQEQMARAILEGNQKLVNELVAAMASKMRAEDKR